MKADAAYVELAEARKAVRAARRAFRSSPDSAFVKTMRGVMEQYLKARSEGVSREDGIRGIEAELRAAWPKSVSKFRPECDACDDLGWVERVCWDQHRCGRKVCAVNPERQHAYVEICHCPKGDRFRPKAWTPDDQIAAVGKTQRKKSGFTRVGR